MAHHISKELNPLGYQEVGDLIADIIGIGNIPMLWGYPGVGKTWIFRALAKAKGMRFIDVYLAQMNPGDVGGFVMPFPDGSGAFRTKPDFFPEEDEPAIILFDEILAAHDRVRKATFQLFMDREIGEYKLRDHHWMAAATNLGLEDFTVIQPMDDATSDRFGHLWLHPTPDDWTREFAMPHKVNAAVISFLAQHPEFFLPEQIRGDRSGGGGDAPVTVLNPRSWTRVAQLLDCIEDRKATPAEQNIARAALRGIIPGSVEEQFNLFRQQAGSRHHITRLLSCEFEEMAKHLPENPEALMILAATLAQHARLSKRERSNDPKQDMAKMELKHAKLMAICALIARPGSPIGKKRKEIGNWCANTIIDAITKIFVDASTRKHDDEAHREEGRRRCVDYLTRQIIINKSNRSTLDRRPAVAEALNNFHILAHTGLENAMQREQYKEQNRAYEAGTRAAKELFGSNNGDAA